MKKWLCLALLFVLALAGCTEQTSQTKELVPGEQTTPITQSIEKEQQEEPATITQESTTAGKQMKVHFIDVGQGDSILIQTPNNKAMLIDGGVKGAGKDVVNYLQKQGVKKLDYVVATHPDADHIGGLIAVLNSIKVGKFIDSGKEHTSQTYAEMITLIANKNIPYIEPKTGDAIKLDKDLQMEVLFANEAASDNNEASIVLKMIYNDIAFLFAADAGIEMEKEILRNTDVKATILKAGHHGSNTSSSRSFLNSVKPEVTILSYGQDNKYGHPHAEVTTELKKIKSKIYGTAESGTIVVETDGKSYKVNVKEWTGIGATSSISPKPAPVEKSAATVEIVAKDLEQDIVTIQNNGDEAVNLKGWTLISVEGDQHFNFPNITLNPGKKLYITSGPNAKIDSNSLEWTKRPIWLNTGDPAKLLDAKGKVVSEYE